MLEQIEVPFRAGYNIGVGADLATGSPMNLAVDGQAIPVDDAAGSAVEIKVKRIQSTEELEQTLGIDAEASYGCGCFGAGISSRFSFAKNSKIQKSSLFMAITVNVALNNLSIKEVNLTAAANAQVDNPAAFAAHFGNMFVRGIRRGGIFVGVFRLETGSESESTKVAGELSGSYGLFSAKLSSNLTNVSSTYKSNLSVEMYHEGGPVGLQIKDPTNPLELLENANLFLQSFQQNPGAVACPYSVQLAPLSIANGVAPPNAADLQHAQDVLIYCAKRRSGILDQLNLLDYINDNQTKFDTSNGASWDAVKAALQTFQDDLDIVASCASNAINHPKDAPMPSDFAREKGKTFPSGKFPDPLPAPKEAAVQVNVPDFSACKSSSECLTAAAGKVKLAYEHVAPQGAFRVIETRPPKGTPVPEGSIVTIVCPATDWRKYVLVKVSDWKVPNIAAYAQVHANR